MLILLLVFPYTLFSVSVYNAVVVEDQNGLLSVVNISTNVDKCYESIQATNQTIYAKDSAIWIYESFFGRWIGHKLAVSSGCSFSVNSWYKKTKSNTQCPDIANMTPSGLPLRKLTKCDCYEIEVTSNGIRQKQTVWVEKKNPVLVDYYEYRGDTLLTNTKDYYVSFNNTAPSNSIFEIPKDITLVDLSAPAASYQDNSPRRTRNAVTHFDSWDLFKSWIGLSSEAPTIQSETARKYHLTDKLRPLPQRSVFQVSHGRLVQVASPDNFERSLRNPRQALDEIGADNIPKEYSVAKEYGTKCPTAKSIYNQGQCGCCWAMAAATVFSDRACIATNGTISELYSTQDLIDCQNISHGCNGGYSQFAWAELVKYGIVTDECKPFLEVDSQCTGDVCRDSGVKPGRLFAKTAYSPFSAVSWDDNVKVIQADILKYGPIEASYYVFSDFMKMSGGVYRRHSTTFEGGHAVRLVGWGEDPDEGAYWLVANSWGESWCENGYFRIARGTNECGFEDSLVAGEINV